MWKIVELTGARDKAVEFATAAHAGATRADGVTPYVTHPLAVADLVELLGGDEETIIAAILHDTIEDTEVTAEELTELFGPTVAAVVTELTFPAGTPHRRDKILAALPTLSDRAKIIKFADAMTNLSDLPKSGWDSVRIVRHANYASKVVATLAPYVNLLLKVE